MLYIDIQHNALEESLRRHLNQAINQCYIPPRRFTNPSATHGHGHTHHNHEANTYPQRLFVVENVYNANDTNDTVSHQNYIPETVDHRLEDPAAILSRFPPMINLEVLEVILLK